MAIVTDAVWDNSGETDVTQIAAYCWHYGIVPSSWDSKTRVRLGKIVRKARLASGMSQEAAAHAGRMTAVTWSKVERGGSVQDLTYSGIDAALDWVPGSAEATLAGGHPTVLSGGWPTGGDRRRGPPTPPEDAINLDPTMTAEQKEVLLGVLRQIRQSQPPPE